MRWKVIRVKGSSFVASTDRKTSLLRDRPARRAVKRAYRIWVSDAAHHCVQRRIDLLFTMSDNLHRVIEDRRDTNSMHGRVVLLVASGPPSRRFGATAFARTGWPSRSRGTAKAGGARRDRTDDLLLAKQALSQLSYGPSRYTEASIRGRTRAPDHRYLIPESGGPGKI